MQSRDRKQVGEAGITDRGQCLGRNGGRLADQQRLDDCPGGAARVLAHAHTEGMTQPLHPERRRAGIGGLLGEHLNPAEAVADCAQAGKIGMTLKVEGAGRRRPRGRCENRAQPDAVARTKRILNPADADPHLLRAISLVQGRA